MKEYIDLLKKIRDSGDFHDDRTGIGRKSLFGEQIRFKMSDGFPLVTTRCVNYIAAFKEMFWFISGSTDIQELDSKIWNNWAVSKNDCIDTVSELEKTSNVDIEKYKNQKDMLAEELYKIYGGSIGPMYGAIWRNSPAKSEVFPSLLDSDDPVYEDIASDVRYKIKNYFDSISTDGVIVNNEIEYTLKDFTCLTRKNTIDQLQLLILGLKNDPFSARHIVTAWIPEFISLPTVKLQKNVFLGKGTLAPCHLLFQCFVKPAINENSKKRLSLQLYQRSADFPIGSVFNIAQYALLLEMIAHCTDMVADEFIYTLGDVHIYRNQLDLIDEQISRVPYNRPVLLINPVIRDIFELSIKDIQIYGYNSHPSIKYPVAI